MRILLHDYGGYPFIFDLSKELSQRGYEVYHIYCSASGSPSAVFTGNQRLKVIDLGETIDLVNKASFISRFKQERYYGKLIARTIQEIKPDIVISANTPLLAQKSIATTCRNSNITFVHWLQDILSIAAENVIRKRSIFLGLAVGAYFKEIEKRCLRSAAQVIVISEDFREVISKWGIDPTKIHTLENWSGIDKLPRVAKDNEFSREIGISDTFNLLYSGTLGMKQNPDVLIDIATHYRTNEKVRIVVVAAGSAVPYLKQRISEQGLNNILLLPLQPFERLPYVLGSSDVLLAMLEPEASFYCVPSKILTYYCAGKPSLLIISPANLAARQTKQNGLGFVVEPGNQKELNRLLDSFIENTAELVQIGEKARYYAENKFSIQKITTQFSTIINLPK